MKVGFIGIGLMGQHMVKHIIKAGHDLVVYDINKNAASEIISMGATFADNPAQVATSSEVVFTSLPRPQDVEEVTLGEGGILTGASVNTTHFDLSTTDPETINHVSSLYVQKGASILDAPVSGGTVGAEKGTLCIMVGGDLEKYNKYKSILETMGSQVMYCGDIGSGAVCKIANNLIGMTLGVVLSEALSMGVKAGVDPMTLYDAISASTGNTAHMKSYPETLFKGNFEPGFKLDLAAKDVGLATDMGRKLRVPMKVSN
jgi:3-hydroxyisobutyrate dehydrogenase-like beta-hydroxyacid dehydrogenase